MSALAAEPVRFRVVATLALFALATAGFVWSITDFWGDDFANFLLLEQLGPAQFLLAPIDVHRTPGHRLLTWLVYEASRMSFVPPVLVMTALHGATLLVLYRLLRLLRTGRVGEVIVCCYAASLLVVFTMLWWAHAQHRMPYVLLDVTAVYQYAAWTRDGRRARLAGSALAVLLAFAFYEKAAFIPLHMLGVVACAFPSEFRASPLRLAWPALLLGAFSAGLALAQVSGGAGGPPLDVGIVVESEWTLLRMLAGGALGILIDPESAGPWLLVRQVCVVGIWAGAIVLSVRRAPSTAWQWGILLGVLALDYLPLTISNRATLFGHMLATQHRFHYEELHLVALFLALIAARAFARTTPGHAWRGRAVAAAAVLGFGLVNAASLHLAADRSFVLRMHLAAHRYLGNLRSGLAQIDERRPQFVNGKLPRTLTLFGPVRDTKTLVPLFMPRARFEPIRFPAWAVAIDGRVVRKY